MQALREKTFVKIVALLLFLLFALFSFGSFLASFYMMAEGAYETANFSFYESEICYETVRSFAGEVVYDYIWYEDSIGRGGSESFLSRQKYIPTNTNFLFEIFDAEGNKLVGNYDGQSYGAKESFRFGSTFYYLNEEQEDYRIDAYVRTPLLVDDYFQSASEFFYFLYDGREAWMPLAIISAVFAIIVYVFILYAAGHKRGEAGIHLRWADRCPHDLYLVICIFLFCIPLFVPASIFDTSPDLQSVVFWLPLGIVCIALCGLIFLEFSISTAIRVKAGAWWRNTIVYHILHWLWRGFCAIGRGVRYICRSLPLTWRTVLVFLAFCLINLILFTIMFNSYDMGFYLLLWFAFIVLCLVALVGGAMQLKSLWYGGRKLAEGELDYKIDTSKMIWDFKKHGDNLNRIGEGMSKAVEERIKSERLKTELITNVSHDIKTPLTSIINYVDLLKKEDVGNENAREYIQVLERQSARLKKLIEDLVEASKASTGNISFNPEPTDVVELLNQAVGEYENRFRENDLEPIVHTPPMPVKILADGRLLWRVFDNLLNNICKYSQPRTRVYLDIRETDANVIITMRNISKEILNVSPDELIERFVRGDSSRSTEGSGLGLSIAQSLTELQNGKFDLYLDGDLFKVSLIFERMPTAFL